MGKYQKIIGKIWEKPGFLRWENHRKRWEHPLSLEIPSKLKWWIFQQTIFDYRTVINPKHNWLLQVMLLLKVVLLEFHVCVYVYTWLYMCVQIDKNCTRLRLGNQVRKSVCETNLQQVQSHKTHRSYWWLSEPSTTSKQHQRMFGKCGFCFLKPTACSHNPRTWAFICAPSDEKCWSICGFGALAGVLNCPHLCISLSGDKTQFLWVTYCYILG